MKTFTAEEALAGPPSACSAASNSLDVFAVVSGGVVRPPERPGHGILWSAEALERYRVR